MLLVSATALVHCCYIKLPKRNIQVEPHPLSAALLGEDDEIAHATVRQLRRAHQPTMRKTPSISGTSRALLANLHHLRTLALAWGSVFNASLLCGRAQTLCCAEGP